MLLLEIKELAVEVVNKRVIEELTVNVRRGEIVLLTGPNGSGKTSLAQTLMGNRQYIVTSGTVKMNDQDLLKMSPGERARSGLFVAWQAPVTIPGVSVFTICKTAYEARGMEITSVVEFKKELERLAERVGLTKEHIGRSVNEGFSGGERKRLELLQILLLLPKLVVLDEIDSGLDEAGRGLVVEIIQELKSKGTAIVVISHYKNLLDSVKVEQKWEMSHGRLQTRI